MIALASLLLAFSPQSTALPTAPIRSLVRVDLETSSVSLEALRREDFDFAKHAALGTEIDIVADANDIERLVALGADVTVVHDDLSRFYAERARADVQARVAPTLGAWLSPVFGSGSMGGFYTFSEIESVLDQITAAYPSITTDKFSIGTSIEGRDLWAVKVSDNPDVDENEPEVRFDSLHHAREPGGMHSNLWALLSLVEGYGTDPLATYLVDNREIWFVLVVNPDGYVYNESTNPGGGGLWRKNRRNNGSNFGVDLNRNYDYEWGYDNIGSSGSTGAEDYRGPSAASEPEVVAMQAFIDSRDFATALTVHSFGDLWLAPWGYIAAATPDEAKFDEIGILATKENSYLQGPAGLLLYTANGVTDDYDYGNYGTLVWAPEIGNDNDGFWPTPSRIVPIAELNELAFKRTALAAGAYLRDSGLTLNDLGDGDGNLEAGESFEVIVDVRNSGQAPGSASVSLASVDPSVIVTGSSASIASVAPFSSADNSAEPLAFTITGGATRGTRVEFTTTVTYDGYAQSTTHSYAIGDTSLYVIDQVETDLGWIVGLPSDTATTGLWEFGDPVGTTYSGIPLNPEDDATANPGVNCFTTGNGSTSSGGDDVDDGLTTLITPAIDLSGVGEAKLSYSRWFGNLGSPADDAFQVSISDDDGVSWTSLETVTGNASAWTRVSFFVSDFVNLTNEVRLRFVAEDDPNNSLVEAAIDELEVVVYDATPRLNLYGSPVIGTDFAVHLTGAPGEAYVFKASQNTALISLPNVVGDILISPAGSMTIGVGSIPANGLERVIASAPNDPGLIGTTYYVQAATVGSQVRMSNRVTLTFE